MSDERSSHSLSARLGRVEGQLETLVGYIGRLVDTIEKRVDEIEKDIGSVRKHVYLQYGGLVVASLIAGAVITKVFA